MKHNVNRRHAVVQPLDQSIKIIPLTRGLNAYVSAEDFSKLNQCLWYPVPSRTTSNIYAARYENDEDGNRRIIQMHREILKSDGDIDHIDGNGLNNVRSNLRPSTDSQNGGNRKKPRNNTSWYKGISANGPNWKAQVQLNGEKIYCGTYKDILDAVRAYDRKAIELFGEFARTNFPRSNYE
jgi:hypothetical protein